MTCGQQLYRIKTNKSARQKFARLVHARKSIPGRRNSGDRNGSVGCGDGPIRGLARRVLFRNDQATAAADDVAANETLCRESFENEENSSNDDPNQDPLNQSASSTALRRCRRIPLTIPGRVERGQCLQCLRRGEAFSQQDLDTTNPTLGPEPQATPFSIEDDADVAAAISATQAYEDAKNNTQNKAHPTVDGKHEPIAPTVINPGAAVYKGPFNQYGERHGRGEMTWANGDKYIGEFFNGVRHGFGELHFADGSEYVGKWECNFMHGEGTRRFSNGDVYTGGYVNNKRNGEQGRFYFANGDMYLGPWRDDRIEGLGRYYYAGGQRFEGEFVAGKRHGKGKMQRLDGSLDICLYVNDQRIGVGVRWSANRTKAWLVEGGRVRKKISIAEAVSTQYKMERDRQSESNISSESFCLT